MQSERQKCVWVISGLLQDVTNRRNPKYQTGLTPSDTTGSRLWRTFRLRKLFAIRRSDASGEDSRGDQ